MLAASGEATFVVVVVLYKSELIGADPLSASMQIGMREAANGEVVRDP